jgi:hypothetical protein
VTLGGISDEWRFSSSFPGLQGTISDNFAASNASFRLESLPTNTLGVQFQESLGFAESSEEVASAIKTGLSFSADLTPADVPDVLSWLVEELPPLHISGPIELHNDAPRMNLQSQSIEEFTVGNLTFALYYEYLSVLEEASGDEPTIAPKTLSRVTAALRCDTSKGSFEIPLSVLLPDGGVPTSLTFESNLSEVSEFALEALTSLIPADIEGLIPAGFPALDQLGLEQIALTVSAPDGDIENFAVAVRLAKTWEVIPDVIQFDDLKLSFVLLPDPAASSRLLASVTGEVGLAGGILDGYVDLSSTSFQFDLQPDSQIDIQALLQHLGADGVDLPDISCTGLQIVGNIRAGTYSIFISLDDLWTLDLGQTQLTLKNAVLGLDFAKGQPGQRSTFSSQIGGTVNIGRTAVRMLASQQPTVGWTFTTAISNLSLNAIAATFLDGIDLPDELPTLVFDTLNITVTPSTRAFSVVGDCTAQWDLPFGVSGLGVSTLAFELSRAASTNPGNTSAPVNCSFALNITNPVTIIDGLDFKRGSLAFKLDQASRTWLLV